MCTYHILTNKDTSLWQLIYLGNKELAELLIRYRADVKHEMKDGLTPLHVAANGIYWFRIEIFNVGLDYID